MAVYNVEPFLKEAIESVVKQDIGFKDNVQLILVDDGSKDSSGEICDEYSLRYSDNIFVIHKENGGVSSARNEGLKYVKGEYVNFLDSDDMLSADALRKVYAFFEKHHDEIDMAAVSQYYFEEQNGPHILNYKFTKGTRVIDLNKEYDCVQLSLSSAFITLEQARKINFDIRLQYAEDAKECVRILLDKQKLGVVSDAIYFYRKRKSGEKSALQNSGLKKAWYMPSLSYFSYSSLNKAKEKCGYVPLFVQYTLMYDLQWRFKVSMEQINSVLDKAESREFINKIYNILQYFDDKVILEQKHIWSEQKCFLLEKKYGEKARLYNSQNDVAVCVGNSFVTFLSGCKSVWEFLTIENGNLYLEGRTSFVGLHGEAVEIYLKAGDRLFLCDINKERILSTEVFANNILEQVTFKGAVINIAEYLNMPISIVTKVNGVLIERKNIGTGKFFPLVKNFRQSYAVTQDYLVRLEKNAIVVKRNSKVRHFKSELKLLKEFWQKNNTAAKKAVLSRLVYYILKPFYSKEIWLISDRINKADDNGEAFFKYCNENNKPVNTYFVLRKDSADYADVAKYGKMLDYLSWKHKICHLLADKLISAAADDFVYNPFWSNEKYYHDILCRQKRVFLQHGIIKDDLSDWLNRYNKNLSVFVTAAKPEYDSIVNGKYFYDDKTVKLTGLCIFDRLQDNKKKIITIMPTWRSSLSSNDEYFIDGIKKYDNSLLETQYYRFYNSLINGSQLLKHAEQYGYLIQFMPHPNLINYIHWFEHDERVKFCSINDKYRNIFSVSSLIITDYSSVAFDFAYLRKPVIYCQFDKEKVFNGGHIYNKGYFDYEKDGFGEVEYDLEGTVNRIIEYMKNGCELKDKYRHRIDSFFAYGDRDNCRRVYDELRRIK